MNKSELRMAAKLLQMAGAQYSNAGCNDHTVPNTPENVAIVTAMQREVDKSWAFEPPEGDEPILTQDWMLMVHLSERLGAAADSEPDIEALAAVIHEVWAHWTKHMLSVLQVLTVEAVGDAFRHDPDSTEYKALAALNRWRRQIETPYAELTEAEKESDRGQVYKVLKAL